MMQETGLGLLHALGAETPALGAMKKVELAGLGCGMRPAWLVLHQAQ
ncbi:hypothetical protein A2U01_0102734, partial [Trifolium medium]|nr:hypothetical protein [Trifolium medium]